MKNFILDTSVILVDPNCIENFEENDLYIPSAVLEELDKFKSIDGPQGYNAQKFILNLDILTSNDLFLKGASLGMGKGSLFVVTGDKMNEKISHSFPEKNIDNRILSCALTIQEMKPKICTILVSTNVSLRMKARALGINTEDYIPLEDKEHNVYNSEEYLIKRKTDLENELREKDSESEELKLTKKELSFTKNELNKLKQQEDQRSNWEDKITESFRLLSKKLDPIKNEHIRLCELYNNNKLFLNITIAILSIWAILICIKTSQFDGFPKVRDYFPFYLPVPIMGGLLWVFIYQINRAQRQILVITEQIHNIEYIEGLLITINKLSPNIEESVNKINLALNKLVENQLTISSELIINENSIKNNINKEEIPYRYLYKEIKEIRSLLGSNSKK